MGNSVYIFGGGDQGSLPVADPQVHVLNIDTWTWSQPAMNGAAAALPRQGHTMASVCDKVYLFGGMAGTTIFGDCWVFDTATFEWTEYELENAAGPSGETPHARSGHAAAVIGDSMYIMGGLSLGQDAAGQPQPAALDDFWQLNTATMKWSSPKLETAPINGRLGHCMCPVKMDGTGGSDGSAAAATPPAAADAADAGPAGAAATATPAASASGEKDGGDGGEGQVINDITPLFTDALPGAPALPAANASAAGGAVTEPEAPNALFIFGGMDTAGAIFEDSLLFQP